MTQLVGSVVGGGSYRVAVMILVGSFGALVMVPVLLAFVVGGAVRRSMSSAEGAP